MNTLLSKAGSGGSTPKQVPQEREIDTVTIVNATYEWILKNNWKPGVPSMTKEDHLAVIEQLRELENLEDSGSRRRKAIIEY